MLTRRTLTTLVAATAFLAGLLSAASQPAGAVAAGKNGRVFFASNRGGNYEVYAMRADGTGLINLTNNSAQDTDPEVSRDGTAIAFISDRTGQPELWTARSFDGTNLKKLTSFNGTTIPSHPFWSPNGLGLVFAGKTGTDSDIYFVKPNGAQLTDLSPDPVAFDANPSWGPGGHLIAFDRSLPDGTTNIYTIKDQDPSTITRLTNSGQDSNPNWGPTKSNLILFESSRNNVTPEPKPFAKIKKPVGVAVTQTGILVTQATSDNVYKIDDAGNSTLFASLPATGRQVERYIAISPGLGSFPAGNVYVLVDTNVYEISPDGQTVNLCITLSDLPNGNNSLTFDNVGTFGGKMIVLDRQGGVWTVDSCNGAFQQIADVGDQIEGPVVAPMSFAPYGGQLLVASEQPPNGPGIVYAISPPPNPVVSTLPNWHTAEGVDIVPNTVCDFGNSQGAYFVALEDDNRIWKFPSIDFTGLGERALVPSETFRDFGLFTSNGTSIDVTQFWPTLPGTTGDMEGSDFYPCSAKGAAAAARPAQGSGVPHEIYSMDEKGGNQIRITNNSYDDIRPSYSPDGTTITFATDRDDPSFPGCEPNCVYEIYSMNPSGGNQTNISNNLSANDTGPDWMPVADVVNVVDFQFDPSSPSGPLGLLGETIMWDFFGPSDHTATDNTGMALFDSGIKSQGQFYAYTYVAAGQYPFICLLHTEMTGSTKVPIKVKPTTGGLTTTFTITPASENAPAGFVYDIQIFRPGGPGFVDWKVGWTSKSATFTPDAGPGVYQFQSRMRKLSGGASNYSKPKSITVTAR